MAVRNAALTSIETESATYAETQALAYLRTLYHRDSRPWVIAYSGGKDSTVVLQLAYTLILELGPCAHKPVFVISSDTCVEAPNIVTYIESVLCAVDRHANSRSLPISTEVVRPLPTESFWVKIIGLGYPPPTRWFRWCTTNMKIKPSRRAIDRITTKYGSAVLLLGTRIDESDDRKKRMEGRIFNSAGLNLHHEIPDAYVATPIADWTADDVWEYLFRNNPAPWNRSHDQLLDLYRQANGGECPVIMDLNTPSCGGSRFGCWTCTVVKMDKSMEGFIDTGDAWMRPLNEFRNWLKVIREDPEYRQSLRRDGSPGPGPFTPEARKIILRRLLRLEQNRSLQQRQLSLISDEELSYIQSCWSAEFDFNRSVFSIAKEYERDIGSEADMQLGEEEIRLIQQLIGEYGLQEELVMNMFSLEEKYPNLDALGAKSSVVDELTRLINKAVYQADIAVNSHDD